MSLPMAGSRSMTPSAPRARAPGRLPARTLALILAPALFVIVVLSLRQGTSGVRELADVGRGLLALLGLGAPLAGSEQTIVELRLFRVVTAAGVGAGLALSGGLLQGVFRNDLASPAVIGISAGASLGASLAILVVGGYVPLFMLEGASGLSPLFVSASAFLFALAVAWLVTALATTDGRISVPTLLLVGIAMNALIAGLLATLQSLVLDQFEVARALISWTFGTLDDRSAYHALLMAGGLALSAAAIPFVSVELDLFAGGEEDAQGLGVDTRRVKLVALTAASLAAATAVSVAGQIAFIGLIVPHLLRLVIGRSHRALLGLCLLGGPVLLLGTDLLKRTVLGDAWYLPPGVVMSLVGGPFFLMLLMRNRRALQAW